MKALKWFRRPNKDQVIATPERFGLPPVVLPEDPPFAGEDVDVMAVLRGQVKPADPKVFNDWFEQRNVNVLRAKEQWEEQNKAAIEKILKTYLLPFYASTTSTHPNYNSRLGEEQVFQEDPADTNRQAFSTMVLRQGSETVEQLEQILDAIEHQAGRANGRPYIVEVSDKYDAPEAAEHADTAAEWLYRNIKPIAELVIPKAVLAGSRGKISPDRLFEDANSKQSAILGLADKDKWVAGRIQELKDKRAERHAHQIQYLQKLEKASSVTQKKLAKLQQDPIANAAGIKLMQQSLDDYIAEVEQLKKGLANTAPLHDWSNAERDYGEEYDVRAKSAKDTKMSLYRMIRKNGWSPGDIQKAIHSFRKIIALGSDESDAFEDAFDHFGKSKVYQDALLNWITELEKDPEMQSDLRLKNILPSIQRRF